MKNLELNSKIVDLAFDAVKFFMMLFLTTFSIFLSFAAVFAALISTKEVGQKTIALVQLVGSVFSVLVFLLMWCCFVLVIKASGRLLSGLKGLDVNDELIGLQRARRLLIMVGVCGALAGSVLIIAIGIFFVRGSF